MEGNHSLATQMGIYLFDSLLSLSTSTPAEDFLCYAQKQFTEDGYHIEYSPTYHRLCVEIVMVVYANEVLINGRVSPGFDSFVVRILECCSRTSIQDATLPIYGDNDSGHIFNFGQSERDFSYLWNSLMAGDKLPCKIESKITQSKIAHRYWCGFFYGIPALKSSMKSFSYDYIYPFKVVSTKSARLIMRVGGFGLQGRAPHDHDDNLSFILQAFGEEIITDKGCPPYTLDPFLREDAISSLSHNVVQIKNKPRSKLNDGSIFKTVQGAATARIIETSVSGMMSAELSLEGVVDIEGDHLAEHVRTLQLSQDEFTVNLQISDRITYQGIVSSQHRIHFAHGVRLFIRDNKVFGEINDICFFLTFDVDGHVPKIAVESFDLYDCYGHSVSAALLLVEIEEAESYTIIQNLHVSNGAI